MTHQSLTDPTPPSNRSVFLLRWAANLLMVVAWCSTALFGLYILAFYVAAFYAADLPRWNKVLPGLYTQGTAGSTTSIGLHFAAGGLILLLGSVQLLAGIRRRWPALHRWIGRVYLVATLLTALGGLAFIVLRGTIGGSVMSMGFGLYGLLTLLAGGATWQYAVAGQLALHRAWALRLYALAIGSWLYRMDYGFWLLLADGLGHTKNFTGPFDQVMAFFFYLPNLLLVEVLLRARLGPVPPALRIAAATVLLLATFFVLVGTYYFTIYYWGPAIWQALS